MKLAKEDKEDFTVFGASFLLHLVVLVCLASFFVKDDDQEVAISILSSPVDEPLPDQPTSIQDITTFSETETRLAPDEKSQSEIVVLDNNAVQQEVTLDDLALSAPQLNLLTEAEDVVTDLSDAVSAVRDGGATNEGVESVGGAVDRLSAEIVRTASEKETLVVWLFDASLSLNAQRQQIAERLAKVLTELELEEDIHTVAHVVYSFGEELKEIIKDPTDDKERIVNEIKSIPLDDSGVENIFTAVKALVSDYPSRRNRRTMLIAFTDEVGDDQKDVDRTIAVASTKGVAVYVVGTPAPFGLAKTQLKFVDPDDRFDQTERWVEIEQGPESLFKMTLNISSLPIDSEPMDSGFGPYALSRLCAQTNGIYFALHPNREVGKPIALGRIHPMSTNIQHFFDSEAMKKYPPDYRAIGIQHKEKDTNEAKTALVRVCSADRIDFAREFKSVFEAPNQGEFVNQLAEGQKGAVSLLAKVDSLYGVMKQGEKVAPLLKEPRWKASYYLAMGRLLASKTRLDAYNEILGNAKTGLRAKNKNTNRWMLEPSNEVGLLGTTLKKQSESAKKYLETVVQEFPGTPWALVAEKELEIPLAYKWVESHYEPVAMNPGINPAPPSVPEDEKKRMLAKPKPPRKLDKI